MAIASCGFIQAAEGLPGDDPEAMARIVEGIITGMGFIGGGAILQLRDSVKGTATAASLWLTGAIGVAVGPGSYDTAVTLSIVTLITLAVLSRIKKSDTGNDAMGKSGEDSTADPNGKNSERLCRPD